VAVSVFAEPLAQVRAYIKLRRITRARSEALAALDLIEQRAVDMEKALRPFVKTGYPRVGIIGRFEVVDVRVNKSEYDAAVAALSAREEAQ